MSNRVVIIGASRGIGLELARQYAARGEEVVAACRRATRQLTEVGCEVVEGTEVTDDLSVRTLADHLAGRPVDILIHNAGILTRETFDDLDFDRIREQFEVNAMGPLRVVRALVPSLRRGSKVGIVSSRVGSLGDNAAGGNYGYRMSKAAVNMAGVNLAHDLEPRGIALILLHPGYVRTDMTSGGGTVDPPDAAAGIIARMDALTLETTGTFWHAEGYRLPW